jgi:small subunit ribosomal protein S8
VSKPSRRVYVNRGTIPRVMGGYGTAIISTSKGVISDKECRNLGVGGEVLCHIW